ncbi:uncharacterized protein LOC62_01G001627 [Vanrija pseudolonga]|uniref:Uncharacterized protein n=1 Tax=Vanrija pseudolonga TaxID=143232 RepID=A0AAF1BJ89_9TREE|nr:hypothetical protein LOC62_01G001627 [Vanrija pseudolonga]
MATILHYAARSSLATCLRVSKQFHEEAGKVLHHTVRIDGSNIAGFFCGALAGTSVSEDSPCPASTLDNCECYPLYDSDDNLIREATATASPNATRQRVPDFTAPNFKGSLLAHVQVLSVGTHHTCACYHYGEHVAPLLYNLHTLCAVPCLNSDGELGTLPLGHPSPEDVITTLRGAREACTVVGLETVRFPSVNLDSGRLRQLVKDELLTGALQGEQSEDSGDDFSHDMMFQTLDEYYALPESERLYELHDRLPSWRASPDVGPSAADLILQPHILHAILQSSDRATLATCLRVNQLFLAQAGPLLYHTVRVDQSNIQAFFRGVYVGTEGTEEIRMCNLLDGRSSCDRFSDRPESAAWEGPSLYAHARRTEPLEQIPGAPTNFKAELLAHVRVLSLGSHHACMCHVFGQCIGPLLKRLDTLRIVHTPATPITVNVICDNGYYCPLFDSMRPRKLVFRNVGQEPLFCCQGWNHEWKQDTLEELVHVLPTDGAVYRNHIGRSLVAMAKFNHHAKVIFDSQWEVWTDPVRPDTITSGIGRPAHPIDVIDCLVDLESSSIYGLDGVHFTKGISSDIDQCELVTEFQLAYPHESTTSERLRQLVKDEIKRPVYWAGLIGEEVLDQLKPFEFHTLAEYALLPVEERRFELDDGLDDTLRVASLESQAMFKPVSPRSLLEVANEKWAERGCEDFDASLLAGHDGLVSFTTATARHLWRNAEVDE